MTDIKKFTSFATSNCYLISPFDNEIVFLIDLPPNIDEVIDYINTNNLTIGGAFITHGHWDHAIGLSSFDSKAYINLDDEHLARNPIDQIGDFLGDKVSVNKYEGNLHNVFDHEYDFLNVYMNPGHTKGSETSDDGGSITVNAGLAATGNGGNIDNWLRNKNTIEFLGVWEQLNNPDFNSLEFEGIMNQAGLNRFHLSVKQWVQVTNAIGILSKTGRKGGTYAHSLSCTVLEIWILT